MLRYFPNFQSIFKFKNFPLQTAAPQGLSTDIADRITGGHETTIEKYPYTVSLRVQNRHHCGASVLTTTQALTAANCLMASFPPSMYGIKAGSTYREDVEHSNASVRYLSSFTFHPQWVPPTTRLYNPFDIAIVQWLKPLVFGASVQPVVLPKSNYPVPYGKLGLVSGWGLQREGNATERAERLRVAATPFLNNTECNRLYNGRISGDMICAGSRKVGRGICTLDEGGPLVHRSGSKFIQIGIASWSDGCARPYAPSVYARVTYFSKWIRENI